MKEDAPQRIYPLREVFNGLRWLVRSEAPWRLMPNDLRELLRQAAGRNALPSAAIFDSRTLQSTPESGARAGYDGTKKRNGSKVYLTLGHLLALHVSPANEQDRAHVGQLAAEER